MQLKLHLPQNTSARCMDAPSPLFVYTPHALLIVRLLHCISANCTFPCACSQPSTVRRIIDVAFTLPAAQHAPAAPVLRGKPLSYNSTSVFAYMHKHTWDVGLCLYAHTHVGCRQAGRSPAGPCDKLSSAWQSPPTSSEPCPCSSAHCFTVSTHWTFSLGRQLSCKTTEHTRQM